jgi:hypothetical protein
MQGNQIGVAGGARGFRAGLVSVACGALALSACGGIIGSGSSNTVSVTVNTSSTGSAINQNLLGVDGPGSGSAVAELTSLGLHFDRTDVGFDSSYNCSNGTWDSSNLDARVSTIEQEGSVPLLIVDYSPSCLATPPVIPDPLALSINYAPPDVGANQAKWDALVQQMAYHEITAEGVRYFEVWNEPDGAFWSGGISGYEQLYSDTATALENAAAQAGVTINVGGPALANLLGTMDTLFLDPFLSYVSSHNLPLNFLSWHTYANDPVPSIGSVSIDNPFLTTATYTNEANAAESALARYPSLHPELIIDEWNVNGLTDARMSQPYGAAFAASVLARAQGSPIAAMAFYNAIDSTFGILNPNLSPRPVYYTFQYWHEMAITQVSASVSNDSDGYIGAVAAKSPNGKITVLIYNFKAYDLLGNYGTSDPTPYDHSVNLTVNGLSGTYSFTRDAIDATHSGGQVGSGTLSSSNNSLTFTVPGEGVTFVTLTPGS